MSLALAGLDDDGARLQVVAHDRAGDAHRLRLAGVDWEVIAGQVGYASGRVASLAVDAYLQRIAVEQAPEWRRQTLQLELARMDALQAAFWDDALQGDRHAAEVVLKVIARRCKVMGYDKADESLAPAARTVVVGGTSEEYINTLQSLIAGTAQ
jgi:hypothetical protein